MAQDKASSSGDIQNNAQQEQSGARQNQPGSQQGAAQQRSDMNPSATGTQQGSAARSGAQQGSAAYGRDWNTQSTGSDASNQRQAAGQNDLSPTGGNRERDFDAPSRYASGSAGFPAYGRYPGGLFSSMRRFSEDMDRLFDAFFTGRPLWSSFDRGGEDDDELGGYRRPQSAFGQLDDYGRAGSQGEQRSGTAQPWQSSPWSDERSSTNNALTSGARSGSAMSSYAGPRAASMWVPRIEMFERDGKLVITADLPGTKKSDVNVELHHDHVTIQGERRQDQTVNERGYYRSERSYGSFYRSIALPDGVDGDSAKATFEDGVLRIEMKAPEQKKARQLDIADSSASARGGTSSDPSSDALSGRKGTSGGGGSNT